LNTSATNNSRYGVEFDGVAKIYGDFSNMSSNAKGSVSPNVTLTSTEVSNLKQNYISTNLGDLTIKTVDSSSIVFKTRDSDTHLSLTGGSVPRTSYLSIKGGNNSGDIPTITATPADGWSGTPLNNLGIKLNGGGGYVDLGSRIKTTAELTSPGIGSSALVPNAYLPLRVNNTTVYLLVRVP
jgi:hypothetical protein